MASRRLDRRAVARGLLTGIAGTAALSFGERGERALLGRDPIYAPERLVRRIAQRLGAPADRRSARLLGQFMRWSYGTSLGLASTLLYRRPGPSLRRVLALGASIAGFELVVLPLVGATPPVRSWPKLEVLLLVAHASVFALGAEIAQAATTLRQASVHQPTGAGHDMIESDATIEKI